MISIKSSIFLGLFAAAFAAVNAAPSPISATDRSYAVQFDKRTGLPVPNQRRDGPSTTDLLNSCPGSSKKSSVEKADNCKWSSDGNAGSQYTKVQAIGQELDNCSGTLKTNLTHTYSESTTFTSTFSLTETSEIDFPGISASLTSGISHTETTANGNDFSMEVPPGQKGRFTAIQYYQPQNGHVFINYGDKVDDHYYWYVYNVHLDSPSGEPVTQPQYKSCSESF